MTWMTCMMHGMVPCSCCTSRSSTGLQVGKSRFVMVAMTWKVYDWTHVFASFVMETTSEWKVWPRHWRSTRRSSSRPQPNVSSSHGFNDKFGLGWPPFRTPSVSCHSTRLNIGSSLQRSAKVTCTLHCLTALPLGISVRFIISFKWPPWYVKTSASWTISLREVASIESMGENMQKCHPKKKWHGWPAWCTAWSLFHAVPQEARLDCRSESPGSSWSPWHGRSTTEHMFLPALSWKPRVNERSDWSIEFHGVIFKAPAKRFIEPWFQWQIWFGLTSFQNTFSIMSLHKAQHWLNPPKVCKSNLHTALSHCTASWHFSALHYQFQMAPIIRESLCVLDNFSAWSSINRINGRKYAKMPPEKNDMDDLHDARHGPLFMHVHAVPQEARLDCRSESPVSSWSPWHGKSTTEHMFLPALSWKPGVNERSGRSPDGQHGVIFKAPAKRFIEP